MPKDIEDFLVGHAGDLRNTHQGRELMAQARKAVDDLPETAAAEVQESEKVGRLKRRRARARENSAA